MQAETHTKEYDPTLKRDPLIIAANPGEDTEVGARRTFVVKQAGGFSVASVLFS